MNFTFKIQEFKKYENRVLVLYTPENPNLEPLTEWIRLSEAMTQEEIKQIIINKVPIGLWNSKPPANIDSLIGVEFSANLSQVTKPEPNRGVLDVDNLPVSAKPPGKR